MSALNLQAFSTFNTLITDWFLMNPDGTNPARFHDATAPEYIPPPANSAIVVGDNAWSPDGARFAGLIVTDRNIGSIVVVQF